MPNHTDLSLSPGQIPSNGKRNLSIPFPTFGAVPFELIDQELDRTGITSSASHLLLIRLFGLLDWTKTVRIGCHDFMSGITGYLSDKCLQKVLRCGSNNTARDAMKKLVDSGLVVKLDKERGHKCPRYQISLFAPVIAFLKENPPETIKIEYLAQDELFNAKFNHTQKDNPKPLDMDAEFSDADAQTAHNQESLEKEEDPTSLGTRTGIADPMPTTEGEGGNSENSQKETDPDVPAASPGPGIEEQKNSLRENQDLSLLPKLLAQEFHDLFGPEEPTEKLINVSALDFFRRADDGTHSGILMDLMRDEKLQERFPDSSARGQACVAVVRGAFKTILKTCDEWGEIKSPRFLNTPTGQRAISKARTEVCRPSLEIDPDTEPATKPLADAVKPFQPDSEPSDEESHTEEKPPRVPLKNAKAQAWQRNHDADKPLHPDAQAFLDRVISGTPPANIDNEPSYKKAKTLRSAKP